MNEGVVPNGCSRSRTCRDKVVTKIEQEFVPLSQ